jgi:YVTN family beta-propeller protein
MARIIHGIVAGLCLAITAGGTARAQDCNEAGAETVVTVPLSGAPFSAIPTRDGCTVFVSMGGPAGGRIAVMRRAGGRLTLAHEVKLPSGSPSGMRLSSDGRTLAAANIEGVVLYDAARLAAGDAAPLAVARSEAAGAPNAVSVYVGISPDNRLLFVADEQAEALTVYDLPRLRGGDTKAIGRIPVGRAPVGLVFSPDSRTLYSTSQQQAGGMGAATCRPPAGVPAAVPNTTPGSLFVIDVATAAKNPAQSIRAKVEVGCDPVRVELSPDGARAYVTARSANTLEVFDTARLASDGAKARIASIPVGLLPVGVAVTADRVVVGNSNRLAQGSRLEWLSVIDPATNRIIGDIPAGGFPREMNLTADGKTLLVTNFASQSVAVIDLAGLTPAYFAAQKAAKAADDTVRAKAAADLQARVAGGQSSPGAEAALRKLIPTLQVGKPDLTLIANPQLAATMEKNSAQVQQRLQEWGAIQSVTFSAVGPNGGDNFIVVFEKQRTRWAIAMAPDGRIQNMGFGPLPPGQ